MADDLDVVLRLVARRERRAIRRRETSALAPAAIPVFGIAPIQIVAEQRTQAIAFGRLDDEPQIITHWNALNREEDYLEAFADELNEYLMEAISLQVIPQIQVAHSSALRLLEMLGHRYRRNGNSSELIRRLGRQCYALAMEAEIPGQQVVVVAVDLLREHIVTGQARVEHAHLGALLSWIDPPPGTDPVELAERAALLPAAAILDREADDRVETLRATAKGTGAEARAAREEIRMLLEAGVRREWEMLAAAYRAFRGLDLPPAPGTDRLAAESYRRISYALERDLSAPSRPCSLAGQLDRMTHSQALTEDINICGDPQVRERVRRAGRVVRVELVRIEQRRRGFRPCTLIMRSEQSVMRVRRGTELKLMNMPISGRVRDIREEAGGDSVLIELSVDLGVRAVDGLTPGEVFDLADTVIYDARFARRDAYRRMREINSPLVYGNALPSRGARLLPAESLLVAASRLRRGNG